jgi:diketogulonate reductase-like aldo/keto reductase
METRPLSPKHPDSPHVPVIGMGTSGTFDTDDVGAVADVVNAGLDAGTTLFDSSPMYGKAERVTGEALGPRRAESIIATKVWTPNDDEAEAQLDASASFYGGHVELMQIHNMVEWRSRLDQVESRRDAGEIGYVGATHWQVTGYDDLEAAMRTGRLDAIQIPYNPTQREVEVRILPLAADLGLGVLIMRPFARADLLRTTPPDSELAALEPFGVTTWGQALLKWCLGHPATTVAIPATTKPARAVENAAAGSGDLFDPDTRARVATLFTAA